MSSSLAVPSVVSVQAGSGHDFTKPPVERIELVAGLGVDGDAHCGATVQHRSRVAVDPSRPNLRQVHLIATELHRELAAGGFDVGPGSMGENVTTVGVDLLALPTGTTLGLGRHAVVEITGLRNPCRQLDDHRPGLMSAVLGRDDDGGLIRRAGVMAIVVVGGTVAAGDPIEVVLPDTPWLPLAPV